MQLGLTERALLMQGGYIKGHNICAVHGSILYCYYSTVNAHKIFGIREGKFCNIYINMRSGKNEMRLNT